MRKIVQGVGFLNAVFGVLVGALAAVSPSMAAAAFKVSLEAPATYGLLRMFGCLLATSGLISFLIARDPDRNPELVRLYAAALLLNVAGDVLVIYSGELQFGQIGSGMMIELVFAVLLLAYRTA